MNRNDDRDNGYRQGTNGIGSSSYESSSQSNEDYGRERSYGQGTGSQQRMGYGTNEGYRGMGRPEYRDYQYGRDYGLGRDYNRDFGVNRDPYASRDFSQDYSREFGRDYQQRDFGRDYQQRDFGRDDSSYGRDRERGWFNRDYERQGFRGRDEERDFWGRSRHDREDRGIGERIGDFFRGDNRDHDRYQTQRWDRHRPDEPNLWDRVKGAFTGKGPKGYTRSDDRIREDVCERLTYHPYVDASNIEVEVKSGEVTLMGTVEDRNSKRLAEDIVEDIRGVKDVHNQIRVRSGMEGVSTIGSTQTSGTTAGLGGTNSKR